MRIMRPLSTIALRESNRHPAESESDPLRRVDGPSVKDGFAVTGRLRSIIMYADSREREVLP